MELQDLFGRSGGAILIAGLVAAAVTGLTSEIVKRFIGKLSPRRLLMLFGGLFVVVTLIGLFATPLQEVWMRLSGSVTHRVAAGRGEAIVVGIYPSDAFGPLQKDGLHNALVPQEGLLKVVDLTASYDDMKAASSPGATKVLDELRELIIRHNVVAVVGPPVTEFTGAVIETVDRTGMHPPIFVTSATPRGPVGWIEAKSPLFRISSGVDERAEEFAALAARAIQQNIPLLFLVEHQSDSSRALYGELVLQKVHAALPHWEDWARRGRISVRRYERGHLDRDIARWGTAEVLDRPQIVMVLGIGGDYRNAVEKFYKAGDPKRQALLGGWMNAYETQAAFDAGAYQWPMLFELTDIDLDPGVKTDARTAFIGAFGSVTPSKRDQAFSFDAGAIVAEAYRAVLGDRTPGSVKIDADFLAAMTRRIRGQAVSGVTGRIRFDALGQNRGLLDSQKQTLTYAWYDGPAKIWRSIPGPEDLLTRLTTAP